MLFKDAYEAMKNGKYAMRKVWGSVGEYTVIMPGMTYIWKIMTIPNPNAGTWVPLLADYEADDWEIFDPSQPIPKDEEVVIEQVQEVAAA